MVFGSGVMWGSSFGEVVDVGLSLQEPHVFIKTTKLTPLT